MLFFFFLLIKCFVARDQNYALQKSLVYHYQNIIMYAASVRSVIKSIEQLANGLVDFAPSVGMYAGFAGDLSILNCWQVPHPDM